MDSELDKCVFVDSQIKSLVDLISSTTQQALYDNRLYSTVDSLKKKLAEYRLEFETKGCGKKIIELSQSELNSVVNKFTNLDSARITEDTNYQLKQRIFFGGLVLVAGLVILTMFNGKKQ